MAFAPDFVFISLMNLKMLTLGVGVVAREERKTLLKAHKKFKN